MTLQKLRLPLFLAAIAAGCAGPSVSYKLNLKPYQLEATDFALPSGLRVLFQEDHAQPSVMVTSILDVGSSDDPVGKEGMAHLIEHLCFRALHGGQPKVMDLLKQLGAGEFNASTGDDYTDYYTVGPKEALPMLLQIEALRLIDPIEGVTEEDLKIEREVVRNELRMRTETTINNKMYELSKEMVFPAGHVYARTGIGTHESLNAITLKDIQDWLSKNYVPSKTTIVVVGDFDRTQSSALLTRNFPLKLLAGPDAKPDQKLSVVTPKPRIAAPSPEPPAPADKTLRRIKGPVTRDTVVLAWSLPGAYRDNEPLIEVTAASMSYAIGSLLYPEDWRNAKDRVDGLGCFPIMNRHASLAMCFIELSEGQTPEDISKRAIDGLWELWNTDNEAGQRQLFAGAKADIIANLFRQSDSLYRAVDIAHYTHYRGRPDFFSGSMERANKMSAFDARDFAYKYLTRDRAVRLLISPYDEKDKPQSVAFNEDSAWSGATFESGKGVMDFAKVTDAQIEALGLATDVKQTKTLTLENGLKVVIKKHGSAPFVKAGVLFGGGRRTASPWGLPDFVWETDSARDPGMIAAVWNQFDLGDAEFVGIDAPSGNLDAALDLVHDRVATAQTNWSHRNFELTAKRLEKRRKVDEKRPEIWAGRALSNLVLPNHPISQDSWDFKKLEAAGIDAYRNWLLEHYAPKNGTLFVVGDIDLADAEAKVRRMWSKWRLDRPGAPLRGYPPPPPKPSRQIALLDNPEGTQTDLRIACHLAPVKLENRAARHVLTGLLREDLWSAIREKAGASYGVSVFAFDASSGLHVLNVSSLVQNDKAKSSMQTILDRIQQIRDGKVTPAKLAEAKWNLAASTHTDNLTNDAMLFTLIDLQRRGEPLDSLTSYPRRVASVSNKDLQDLLAPCAGSEVGIAVGPEAGIRKSIESIGIPVVTVDWKKGSDAKPAVN